MNLINKINDSLNDLTFNDITLILIDESGSMSNAKNSVKDGLKTLINNMSDDKIIIIVSFNSILNLKFSGTIENAKNNLIWNNYEPSNLTCLHDSFVFTYDFFKQLNNNINIKIWICITDGNDTSSICSDESWISALNNLRNEEVLIQLYALGSDLYNKYSSYFNNGSEITTWTYDNTQEIFNVASNSSSRYRSARSNGYNIDVSRTMSQTNDDERILLDRNYIRNNNNNLINNSILQISDNDKHIFLDYAKNADFEKCKSLILQNNSYINVQPNNRWSVLHQAAFFGNSEMVLWLLNHGADKNLINNQGKKPLDVAYGYYGDIQPMNELL